MGQDPELNIDFGRISPQRLAELVSTAPKAELHIHIEGSLEPEMIFSLAQRNGVRLAYSSVQALRSAYRFRDLQSFLDVYYAGASVLLTEADFHDMAWAYLTRAARDGVVCAEIFFDPQTHTERGVDMGVVVRGLSSACRKAEQALGLRTGLILCFLRHLSQEAALDALEQALPFRQHLLGVGLDSSEKGHPPQKFAQAFARAAELGLRRVAHAGEEGPAAYIRSALDDLGAERIDHGVRCTEDPELVRELAQRQIPLTVCPLSNIKLGVFSEMRAHNLPELLRAGLAVTVNSDDPAYFGGYVNDNYVAVLQAHPAMGPRDAWKLLRNSLLASFAAPEDKQAWLARLDSHFAAA